MTIRSKPVRLLSKPGVLDNTGLLLLSKDSDRLAVCAAGLFRNQQHVTAACPGFPAEMNFLFQ